MKLKTLFLFFLSFLVFVIILAGCEQSYTPKPRGYFRIDLPQKSYIRFEEATAYSFEYPSYAIITSDVYSPNEKDWYNIEFPALKAVLHISFKKVNDDLNLYVEDARTMAFKHLPKANAITDSIIDIPEKNIFGAVYQIQGKGVASPIQFYITDSSKNFVRAALYFNIRPNNDSIAPVIQFVKADLLHFIETLEWK